MHIKTSELEKLQLGIGDYSCNWGTHICGLYETEKERDEIIFGVLGEGCKANDKQIFIHSEQSEEYFWEKLQSECPACSANKEDTVRIDLRKAKEMYYPEGVFDPWHMLKAVNGYFDYTQADGKNNMRGMAEMAWALQAIKGVEHLFAYESRLNYFVQGRTILVLCLYNITKISGATIMNVLRTHPFTVNGGVISANPYYEDPDNWLTKNAPQFLNPKG